MKDRTNAAAIISEHRANPGAAVRGLTQLLMCAQTLAIPIAATADPAWRAIADGLEALLVQLDAMDIAAPAAQPTVTAPPPAAARRRAA